MRDQRVDSGLRDDAASSRVAETSIAPATGVLPVGDSAANLPSHVLDATARDAALATPTPQPLFRSEAIEARRSQWLGPVLLLPRPSHTLFAGFAALAVAALIALLAFGEYTSKARVNGWLVPQQGLVQVYAPQVGVVSEIKVKEGVSVRQGDPLVVVSAERQSARVGGTEAEIGRLLASRRGSLEQELIEQQQQMAQQRAGIGRRLAAIRDEVAQIDSEIAVQASRRQLATASAERMRELAAQGFASKMQLQREEEAELDQRGRLRTLQRTRSERLRELAALQAEYDDLPFKAKAQAAALGRNIAELEQESVVSDARRTFVIPAPQSGTVTALQTHVGSNAAPATPLLSIVPQGSKLEAHLFAASRSVGFINPGQDVLLRYQAFPYQKFGHHRGRVASVSTAALTPSDLPVQQAGLTGLVGTGEPVYRIVVELDSQQITAYGNPRALQPGMQLESDVLLDRRKLYEWLLEPLYTLTGKL